jgi:hypothetical protein
VGLTNVQLHPDSTIGWQAWYICERLHTTTKGS